MEKVIEKFKELAQKKYGNHIQQMIIFGSYVRGDQKTNSDIDILVVWKGNRKIGWEKLEEIAFRILLDTEKYISLKVITPEEYRAMEANGNPFIKNITKEGTAIL